MRRFVGKRAVGAIISAAALVGTTFMAVGPASAGSAYLKGVDVSGAGAPGSQVQLVSKFVVPRIGRFLLDTEVVDTNNNRVAQFYEDVDFSNSLSISRQYTWDTTNAQTGTYAVKQGLFNADWAGQLDWRNDSGSVTLKNTAPAVWNLGGNIQAPRIQGSHAQGSMSVGSTLNVTGHYVTPPGVTGDYMLDTEIFSTPANVRAGQWFEARHLTLGQVVNVGYLWDTSNLAAGSYVERVHVFSADWSHLFAENDNAKQVTLGSISSRGTTPSTQVPKPTTTTAAPSPPTTTEPSTTTTPAPLGGGPRPGPSSSGNPLAGDSFYGVNQGALDQASLLQNSDPTDAALLTRLGNTPSAQWLGAWSTVSDVQNRVNTAASQGKVPVFVLYNIPNRDCGGYSAGGASTPTDYHAWVQSMATALGYHKVVISLEPDSVALISCLSSDQLQQRWDMLKDAESVLSANPNATIYLDAGHSGWNSPADMAQRLQAAGIAGVRGFATNVSNYIDTNDEMIYANQLATDLGGKHFVIDTSRNGNGSPGIDWCNPSGQAVGVQPTANTGSAGADAFLWMKVPGESDGTCNGGPSAGVYWPQAALALAKAAWT